MAERARNRMILGATALASLLALSACGSNTQPTHACPQVLILGDAERFTQYRPGGGRDITDIEAQGEISGFRGTCTPTRDGGLDVTLAVAFELQRGAGDADRTTSFEYFVAIPAYYPAPEAKAVLPVRVGYPAGQERVRFIDEEVTLSLPRRGGEDPASYDIYIGFQLDAEQLRHNRQR